MGDLRADLASPSSLLKTATLLAFFGLVAVTLWMASAVSVRLSGEPLLHSFSFVSDIAPSLIPIAGLSRRALLSLWVYQGQYAWRLLTDPLGTGATCSAPPTSPRATCSSSRHSSRRSRR